MLKLEKNNLHNSKKKLYREDKNILESLVTRNSNKLQDLLYLDPLHTVLANTIYNQFYLKRTKKTKKIMFLHLLQVSLKKLFYSILCYQKYINLLTTWFNKQIMNHLLIINKIEKRSLLLLYYIKKKTNLFLYLIETLKLHYIFEFTYSFFKKNKKLKILLEKQLNFQDSKNKQISMLMTKVRNILFYSFSLKDKTKSFLKDYLFLMKTIKKELISSFYVKDSTELYFFLNKKYNISWKSMKLIINNYKFKNWDQLILFLELKKSTLYQITFFKKEFNILKWILLSSILNKKTFYFLRNTLFTLITKNFYIAKFTLSKTYTFKEINDQIFLFKWNHIANNLNSKNTLDIYNKLMKDTTYIYEHFNKNQSWFDLFIHKKINLLLTKQEESKKKIKKKLNRYFNKIIYNLNKKYGITYSNVLLNDSMYYWTFDLNQLGVLLTNTHIINELQKKTFIKIMSKFYKVTTNNISSLILFKNLNCIELLKEKINSNLKNIFYNNTQFNYLLPDNKEIYMLDA